MLFLATNRRKCSWLPFNCLYVYDALSSGLLSTALYFRGASSDLSCTSTKVKTEMTWTDKKFWFIHSTPSKTFCNHANQNLLHYSTSLQKQINVGCLTVLWHLFSWVYKVTGSCLRSHLLYRRILRGLCSPEQRQLWFLPHLTMAERVQACDRLKVETNSFQLFLI